MQTTERTPDARIPLHLQAKLELAALIAELTASGARKLPNEDELSRVLGLSRPTVRSALAQLQQEGLIRRSHGRGTFINRFAVESPSNIAIAKTFLEQIRELGNTPSVELVAARFEDDSDDIASRLGGEDRRLFVVRRRFFADGEPAIFSIDHIVPPVGFTPTVETVGISTFDLVREAWKVSVAYSVASLHPVSLSGEAQDMLGLAPGTPVLRLDHLHVDRNDEPRAVTRAWLNDRFIRLTLVREYTADGVGL